VAILERPGSTTGPEIVLQKQYRPPIDKITIEVPAGLVDEGETAEEAAVRELREETGYVGVVSETTPTMFNGEPATLSKLFFWLIFQTLASATPT
jgi:ADP-ribose diphosphatase